MGLCKIAFCRSLDPVLAFDISITRMAVADGNRQRVRRPARIMSRGKPRSLKIRSARWAASRSSLTVSTWARASSRGTLPEQTGFTKDDLKLLFEAVLNMFEHDRSASKGVMTVRAIYVFKHVGTDTNAEQRKAQAMLGCAPGASAVRGGYFGQEEGRCGRSPPFC